MTTIQTLVTFQFVILVLCNISHVFSLQMFAPSIDQTIPRWPFRDELERRATIARLLSQHSQFREHLNRLQEANNFRRSRFGEPQNVSEKQQSNESDENADHKLFFGNRSIDKGLTRKYTKNYGNEQLYDRLMKSKQKQGRRL